MNTKIVLLIIGVFGLIASLYASINEGQFQDQIIGFVCSTSLIWGYYELDKKEKQGK